VKRYQKGASRIVVEEQKRRSVCLFAIYVPNNVAGWLDLERGGRPRALFPSAAKPRLGPLDWIEPGSRVLFSRGFQGC
jgi:hypothetical protein